MHPYAIVNKSVARAWLQMKALGNQEVNRENYNTVKRTIKPNENILRFAKQEYKNSKIGFCCIASNSNTIL